MARRIFHSFRFSHDHWRVQTVRHIGSIEGQKLLSPNEWEAVKKQGDQAVRNWINGQLSGRSCVVVLIGSATAGRPWVNYEMDKGWEDGKGVVGVYIHGLKNSQSKQAAKGANPLTSINVSTKAGPKKLSSVAKTHDPPYKQSSNVYSYIKDNIEDWVEEAIAIRKAN